VDVDELAGEQPQHVHHVDALVEQNPAAGYGALGAPVGGEVQHLGLAVDAAEVEHRPQLARANEPKRVFDRVVITVVESVLEAELRVAPLGGQDAPHLLQVARRRLLAEHVEPAIQPGDRDLRRHVVAHRHEQHIQRFAQKLLIRRVEADAVWERTRLRIAAIANGDHLELRMLIDDEPPSLPDDPVPRDADAEPIAQGVNSGSR